MSNWKSLLKGDATDWLLEEANPSVRYHTLRWLLDLPDVDPDVSIAAQSIAESAPVQKLLSRQRYEGYWGSDNRPHHGTKRFLLLLLWLGYRADDGVKRGMEYLINGCLLDDGSYGIELKGRTVKLPCHAADLLRMMLWAGYEKDPRTKRVLSWLVGIRGDDGI